jgi:CBS domain-containing protein
MLAERALEYAAGVAQSGATLVLVRVEESKASHHTGEPSTDESETFGEATRYLLPIPVRLAARGLRASTDIRQGRPAEQILAAAREHAAVVIVMATHGRSGPARWLLGSVADEVVRHADRPVLLVSARMPFARGSAPNTIGDLLTSEPVVVREDESLDVVLRKLLRQRTPVAAVVNVSGDPVGMVSERGLTNWHDKVVCDLAHQEPPARDAYARRMQAEAVAGIMTPLAPVLDASTPVDRAMHFFRERGVSRLPVMRDGKLIGILTRTDILKAMAARLRAEVGVENPSD